MQLIAGASALLSLAAVVAVGVLSVTTTSVPWPLVLILLVVGVPTELLVWLSIKPPTLRIDALSISCDRLLVKQRMPRSDLQSIFRGQALIRGRNGSQWQKTYAFVGRDGKIGLTCSPNEFTADGMQEFASRLGVPIRGDFTVQVKDRVVPQST
jgi:hypothetical protein